MSLLKRNTRFFVLVGVLLLVGLAIACTNEATEPDSVPLQPVIRLHYGGKVYDGVHLIDKENIYIAAGAKVKPGVVLDAEGGPIFIWGRKNGL